MQLRSIRIIFFAETCPQSWKYWNEKCYYISDNQQTFNISLDKCREVDGEATLLSWHSQEEVDYVQGLILRQLLIQLPCSVYRERTCLRTYCVVLIMFRNLFVLSGNVK